MEAEFSHLPVMAAGGGGAPPARTGRPDRRLHGRRRRTRRSAARRASRHCACSGSTVTPMPSKPLVSGSRASARERSVVHGGFEQLGDLVAEHGEGKQVMGILMDLGVSSPQLDRAERGFSYRFDAPLDMRMDAKQALTAADVVNTYDEDALAAVIARYGEERFATRGSPTRSSRPARCTRRASSPTIVRDAIPAPRAGAGSAPGPPHVPGDPHGGQPRAPEPRGRARRVGAPARVRKGACSCSRTTRSRTGS